MVWTGLCLQLAGEEGSCPALKRWGLPGSIGEGETILEERQRTETGRDSQTETTDERHREPRDESEPEPEPDRETRETQTEGSALDQAWQGGCGAGAAAGGPPWRAQPAPQLAGPWVRKLKVSYVRVGAGRGAPGPGAPSRCAPPARSSAAAGPAGACRAGQGGAGGAVGDCAALQGLAR